ncbi:MAG: cyclase family protein [Acidobacteriota bacterium]|jgi:arylformamidase|nr:cyclase family protein [Acidobacteriota bacterium]
MTTLIDITRRLGEGLAVWPGDPEFRRRPVWRLEDGAPANVEELRMGTHAGTHLDAPRHVLADGAGPEAFPLAALVGPARVFDLAATLPGARRVRAADLGALDFAGVRRAIFKTSPTAPSGGGFESDYAFLGQDAAERLVARGILLVGTDAMSVDPAGARDLRAHRRLLAGGVAILEGLELGGAPPGDYELLCLPLRIDGVDGVPARAVLRRFP